MEVSIPYGRQSIDQRDIDAVTAVLRGDWLTTGPAVDEFEARLGEIVNCRNVTAVSSGTAALHSLYSSIEAAPGSEVVTPPLTFVATQAAAIQAGLKVTFADVRDDNGCIDLASVKEAITPRTVAVCAVDYAGHPAVTDELVLFCREHGLLVVEDAAHSLGSRIDGRSVGELADLTAFSFFPTKNITTGEGGAVVSRNASHGLRVKEFARQGLVRDPSRFRMQNEGTWHQEVHNIGLNYRLPDILAALGVSQLGRLEAFKMRRNEIFNLYNDILVQCPDVVVPRADPGVDAMWHLYPLRVPEGARRALYDFLRGRGIRAQVNYIPAYWHPYFEDAGVRRGICPKAEAFYRREISLPIHVGLSDDEVSYISETVISFFGSNLA